MTESSDILSSPRPMEIPRKRNSLSRVLWVLFFVVIFLVLLTCIVSVIRPARASVRGLISQLFGVSAASTFERFAERLTEVLAQIGDFITHALGNVGNWFSDLFSQLAARWNELVVFWSNMQPEFAFNDALQDWFGPGAPTLHQITSSIPGLPFTGDPVSDTMIIIIAVCIPLMVLLWLVIRHRDAAYRRGEALSPYDASLHGGKRHHSWWVWIMALLSLVVMVCSALLAFLTAAPGWIILTFILLGFTTRTFRADV